MSGKQGGYPMNKAPVMIEIITTGGTIEKSYDEEEGLLTNAMPTIERKIFSKLRLPYTQYTIHALMNKDSLYMNEQDRQLILDKIVELQKTKNPILVVHGTDTMALSAELVASTLPSPAAPVAFTGAMRPMGMDDSDAIQNVTEALMALKLLRPGVYLSFHNQVFPVPGVQKNKEKRTFEWLP